MAQNVHAQNFDLPLHGDVHEASTACMHGLRTAGSSIFVGRQSEGARSVTTNNQRHCIGKKPGMTFFSHYTVCTHNQCTTTEGQIYGKALHAAPALLGLTADLSASIGSHP